MMHSMLCSRVATLLSRAAWRAVLAAAAICLAGTFQASAAPLFEEGDADTREDTLADIWVEDFLVDSEYSLDYTTLEVDSAPLNGTTWIDTDVGAIEYMPDTGYTGFDALSYTIRDEMGQLSNIGWIYIYVEPDGIITNAGPVIANFRTESEGMYTFFLGLVLDENPAGLTVTFGGFLEGITTTTYSTGDIIYWQELGPYDSGLVTAETEDEWEIHSNVAAWYVDRLP